MGAVGGRAGITLKLTLAILAVEAVFLGVVGFGYIGYFGREVDAAAAVKLALPGRLMSASALGFDAVTDLGALGALVGERVEDAFVVRRDGVVFYAADPAKLGRPAAGVLAGEEAALLAAAVAPGEARVAHVRAAGGRRSIAVAAPLAHRGSPVGTLWMKVDADELEARKARIVRLFLGGSLLAVLATTLIASRLVHRLFVPRVRRMVAALEAVAGGDHAARVAEPGSPDEVGSLARSVNATIDRLTAEARFRADALDRLGRAERQYRELFASAVEGIFQAAADGRLLAANPSCARLLGYGSAEELLANVSDLGGQVWAVPGERDAFLRRLEAEGTVLDAEALVRRRDGTVLPVSLTARGVRGGDGRLALVEGSVVDISERRRREEAERRRAETEAAGRAKAEMVAVLEERNRELAEALERLRETQEQLVRAEKMAAMGTMAGGVAHDLNNILAGIVGYPDLLLAQAPADPELREGLEVIRESGQRAAAVVADLLTLARGAAYVTQACDLNALVGRHLQSPEWRQLAARHPGVRVQTRLAAGLRPVRCSPVHLQKAVLNLAMNAVEAVRDAGTVTIATENRPLGAAEAAAHGLAAGDHVALTVADDGPGIAPADLARIFEPFFTKKALERSGTGLGLAVVWNTVQEHGGAVYAESAGRGATLTVLLPAAAEPAAAEPPAAALASLRGEGSVLVVDDEPRMRLVAGRMLAALGYRVETAASGEEAVRIVRERPFDLVLLDMIMPPGMNGAAACREIRRERPGQRAVISSGFSGRDDLEQARAAGAGGFLRKPYTLEQLAAAVRAGIAGEA